MAQSTHHPEGAWLEKPQIVPQTAVTLPSALDHLPSHSSHAYASPKGLVHAQHQVV